MTPSSSLRHQRYTRSDSYDPAWVTANQMGPNALWLTESLSEVMPITSDMNVLDLGCGRAMSSIFIAKEFGAKVWATDLRIDVAEFTEEVATCSRQTGAPTWRSPESSPPRSKRTRQCQETTSGNEARK